MSDSFYKALGIRPYKVHRYLGGFHFVFAVDGDGNGDYDLSKPLCSSEINLEFDNGKSRAVVKISLVSKKK